jgi:S1-C subfamily serine protease
MSDFNERPGGWVPLEGSGAWVPANTSDAGSRGPAWPPPAAGGWGPSAQASPPPPPPPPPASPPAGGPGGWWVPGGGQPAPAAAPRHRRVLPAVVTAGLAVIACLVGLGIGHAAWPSRSVVNANAQGSSNVPSNSGNSGSGSSGSGGSSLQDPFGSGGSSGSGGSFGSGGSGQLPFGSGGSGSSNGNNSASGSPSDTAAIAARVSPDLVDINSTFSYQQTAGAGTGIVLTSNGLILTNNHVINGATRVSVTDVGNGKTYNATVLGYDDSHDIALVQLQGASGLQTAKLGNSSTVATGEGVVAIGNAGGTGGTPSYAGGSVVATDQSITAGDDLTGVGEQLSGLIETNANIQPGDSGGSLVDTAGQVIGIDTAASQGFSFDTSGTQGFAIPIDAALAIAHQIESGKGTATTHVGPTAFLGVELSTSGNQGSSPSQGNSGNGFGGSFGGGSSGSSSNSGSSGNAGTAGVPVSGVVSGGPAASAGLASGDTITSLNGRTIDSPTSISAALVPLHPGDKVQLGWVDSSGQSHTATVDLGSGPPA